MIQIGNIVLRAAMVFAVIVGVLFAANFCVGSSPTSGESSAGWTPEILTSKSTDNYLPDFSYAGYCFSEKSIPSPAATLKLTDLGAIADDDISDAAAFAKAFDQAAKSKELTVIQLPPGKLIVDEILTIKSGNWVLRGAGSGEGGTTIYMPKPLKDLPRTSQSQELTEELKENDKLEKGKLYSPFSWSGGMFWLALDESDSKTQVLANATGGKRGEHVANVDKTAGLAAGQVVRIQWFNRDGEKGSLLKHIYGTDRLKFGKRLYESPDKPLVKISATIAAVGDGKVTFIEPLPHDLDPAWTPQLVTAKYMTEIGIESIRFEFPKLKYAGHHLEDGCNAIYFGEVANGWIKDVSFHNVDSGVIVSRSRNVTVENIKVTGRQTHYCVTVGQSEYVLFRNFDFQAPTMHVPSFNTGARLCVYSGGKIADPRVDQHCGINHQNLVDNVDLTGSLSNLFNHGGADYWRPTAGAFNTFWNFRLNGKGSNKLGGVDDAPFARLVGFSGTSAKKVDYGPNAYQEGIGKDAIGVPSLFEYQLKKRLAAAGQTTREASSAPTK